jgi:hypothetical protein
VQACEYDSTCPYIKVLQEWSFPYELPDDLFLAISFDHPLELFILYLLTMGNRRKSSAFAVQSFVFFAVKMANNEA